MELIWFLLVGLIAGWLASAIVGGGFGLIGDIVIGVVGAFLGGYLFRTFGFSAGGGMLGSIIVATVGAIVLLLRVRIEGGADQRHPGSCSTSGQRPFQISPASSPFKSPSSDHENAPRRPCSRTYFIFVSITLASS